MSFKAIHSKIVTKLQAISKLQDVKSDPLSEFSGYPACYILESDSSSDYDTNTENLRVYSWNIRIFYQVADNDSNTAYEAMRDLVDDVLNAFDKDYLLSGVVLPSGYTMMGLVATPSIWLYLEQEKLLVSELKISAKVSVDLNV